MENGRPVVSCLIQSPNVSMIVVNEYGCKPDYIPRIFFLGLIALSVSKPMSTLYQLFLYMQNILLPIIKFHVPILSCWEVYEI